MDAQTVNATFDLLSLAESDTTLKRSGTYHTGACPFCGGRDRFTLKQTGTGYKWHCRKCGDGKYHTAIDYVMQRDNLDFKTALAQLGGEVQHSAPRARTEPAPPAIVLPGDDWQRAALAEVWAAWDALDTSAGEGARAYLQGRGISVSAAGAWLVGFAHAYDPKVKRSRAALSIPWWERTQDGAEPTITAIKYRFVDNDPGGARYTSRSGGAQVLYGLWDVLPTHHTLLLVEGEINALSAWQMHPEGVTVLSFGSEGATQPAILKAIASRYKRVFVWADNPEKAAQLRGALPGSSALQSPHRDGIEWDANQMLQAHLLGDFLSKALGVDCTGQYI